MIELVCLFSISTLAFTEPHSRERPCRLLKVMKRAGFTARSINRYTLHLSAFLAHAANILDRGIAYSLATITSVNAPAIGYTKSFTHTSPLGLWPADIRATYVLLQ